MAKEITKELILELVRKARRLQRDTGYNGPLEYLDNVEREINHMNQKTLQKHYDLLYEAE